MKDCLKKRCKDIELFPYNLPNIAKKSKFCKVEFAKRANFYEKKGNYRAK